jgi:antitoxin component of RelBE/YafQ-DinJ toxin-antitoxin module
MSTVLLTIKTDADTKDELKSFAVELGISTTAFVNMLVKQALRDRRVVLSTTLEPTPYLEKIMREVEEDLKTGKNISPEFDSVGAMFEHLNKTA